MHTCSNIGLKQLAWAICESVCRSSIVVFACLAALFLLLPTHARSETVDAAIEQLRNKDQRVRQQGADALVRIGTPAVPPLIADERNWDYGTKTWTIKALTGIGRSAVEPLLAALPQVSASRRCDLIRVLGAIHDARAIAPLIERLSDPESYPYSSDLFSRRGYVRHCAASALRRFDDPRTVQPLREALTEAIARRDFLMMNAASSPILSKRADTKPVIDLLIAALRDQDAKMRYHAACTLARIKDPRAADALISALRDRSYYVDDSGVHGQGPNAHLYVGACVGDALAQIKPKQAIEPLISAMRDKTYGGRLQAARALAEIDDPRAIAVLRAVLMEKDRPIIEPAYRTMIRVGDRTSEDALIEALKLFGNATMAVVYLNCGNARLENAARDWVSARPNLQITPADRAPANLVRWGAR